MTMNRHVSCAMAADGLKSGRRRSGGAAERELRAHRLGAAEVEALAEVALERDERDALLVLLDALSDDCHAERARELDDHPHERSLPAAARQAVDERLGDLEYVEGQGVEVAERGVSGSEVVE